MIRTKQNLQDYISTERALWIHRNYPNRNEPKYVDCKKELQFVKALRHVEYALSLSGPKKWMGGGYIYWKLRYTVLSKMNHVEIPPFVFDKGLMIVHLQNIVVSAETKVGKYCCLYHNTTMGISNGRNDKGKCPVIGDGVTVCVGAGLFGNIEIADGITVGANAVVTKSFQERNCVIGGIPAKVISHNAGFKMLEFKDKVL